MDDPHCFPLCLYMHVINWNLARKLKNRGRSVSIKYIQHNETVLNFVCCKFCYTFKRMNSDCAFVKSALHLCSLATKSRFLVTGPV